MPVAQPASAKSAPVDSPLSPPPKVPAGVPLVVWLLPLVPPAAPLPPIGSSPRGRGLGARPQPPPRGAPRGEAKRIEPEKRMPVDIPRPFFNPPLWSEKFRVATPKRNSRRWRDASGEPPDGSVHGLDDLPVHDKFHDLGDVAVEGAILRQGRDS